MLLIYDWHHYIVSFTDESFNVTICFACSIMYNIDLLPFFSVAFRL